MTRKTIIFTAAALCAASFAIGAASENVIKTVKSELRPDFTIVIDGQQKTFKNVNGDTVYPLLYDGTAYLPIRAIGELMGKTVYWYEKDKRIELIDAGSTVTDADVIIHDTTAEPSQAADEITSEKAKEIALQKAGLSADEVKFTKVKLDIDNGIREYEIEFKKDQTKYSADIKASDGTITSWETETDDYKDDVRKGDTSQQTNDIGLEKAKEAALKKAGLSASDVIFTETSVDMDKGRKVYEIEFRNNKTEYSADILASDGTIISWEKDIND